MTDPHPTFQSETLGDVTIVTLQPADFFDQQTIAAAKRELLLFVKTEKPAKLILRFANIQRFSSAFFCALVNLKEHIRFHHSNAEIKLCELQSQHREIFKLVDPNQTLFKLYDTVKDAFTSFS